MIRVNARYHLATDDFAVADQISDAVMDALMTIDGIADPDVAVSMTERSFEVWLGVPTDDVSEAFVLGANAVADAFAKAGLTIGQALAPADMHAEPIPA